DAANAEDGVADFARRLTEHSPLLRDERPAGAPGDKPAARKPQVKRRPKPAGDGMRPGFRR
ncbi:hypothetical protein RJ921_00005, partial [Pseudomonas aeruginosa]